MNVWLHCFVPRRVDLREGVKDPADDTGFIDRPCPKARSSLPITLFVNYESRKLTLLHYYRLTQPIATQSRWFSPAKIKGLKHIFLGNHLVKQPSSNFSSNCNVIYFNPKIDHLFLTIDAFRNPSMPQYVLDILQRDRGSSSIVDEIEHIEIYCTGSTGNNLHGARVLRMLKNLKTMNIIFGKEPGGHDERRETVVAFDMTQRGNTFSGTGDHMKVTVKIDGNRCIPYYKEKNEKERVKVADQRPYGLVPMLGLIVSSQIESSQTSTMDEEKAFVASKLEISSSTSENEQFSFTAKPSHDSKSGNDAIKNLSSKLPDIADSGLSQETSTDLTSTRAIPATTFLRFPHLFLELRNKIWRHSFPRQNLMLGPWSFMKPKSFLFQDSNPPSFRACNNLPMAFANRESRAETLKHYHVIYQAHYRSQETTSSSDTQAEKSTSNDDYQSGATNLRLPHVMYFNLKVDCLSLVYPNFYTTSSEIQALFPLYDQKTVSCLERIRVVKIYHAKFEENRLGYYITMNGLPHILECFKSLQRVELILHPRFEGTTDDLLDRDYVTNQIKNKWTGNAELKFVWGRENRNGVFCEILTRRSR
ncbi:uncharacterized protein EAF01_005614 [Botrytis porri]|nr:uncharacterized protein EAF01_005614 [Botrytis porri]KAF7905093.1 hypothetical protein EAF01_005614 [Botrytis porri]